MRRMVSVILGLGLVIGIAACDTNPTIDPATGEVAKDDRAGAMERVRRLQPGGDR